MGPVRVPVGNEGLKPMAYMDSEPGCHTGNTAGPSGYIERGTLILVIIAMAHHNSKPLSMGKGRLPRRQQHSRIRTARLGRSPSLPELIASTTELCSM